MSLLNLLNNDYFKIILYASRLRFPKCPSYFFTFYMYIVYTEFLKKNQIFIISPIPDNLMLTLLYKYAPFSYFDANNCVLISKTYCQQVGLENYAKLTARRRVQIFPLDVAATQQVFIGDTLRFNLDKASHGHKTKVTSVRLESVKVATDVEICLINTHNDLSNTVVDGLLKNYFASPKLVHQNDVVTVNLKRYGGEFFYTNVKINDVENVYFKCVKVKCGDDVDCDGGCFCVYGETTLKQSSNIQDYLVPCVSQVCNYEDLAYEDLSQCLVDKCPNGLEAYLHTVEKAVNPFLRHKRMALKPVFLVQGHKGIGKNTVVSTLAAKLGMNLYKISSGDVASQAYAQTEIKIKNVFFKAKLCSPCIVVINNFENFGKNNEGQFDQRIIDFFKTELNNFFTNNSFPIVLLCVSNSKDLPADLSRVFLEVFSFQAPTQNERARLLQWILKKKNLSTDVDYDDVASKTHGFLFGDLEALVYYAHRNWYESAGDGGEKLLLRNDDFQIGLEIMQSNYTESLGTPKVPKVQWSDVGGLNDVKHEIIRTINLPLKYPELLKTSGLKRSGILLYGPPGTGKTLIAKAVATECSLCFLSVKGPELLNMYVGQSEQNVREVFERARQAAPCIIFFDELDALAPNRGISGDSGGVMDRVVSQLLSEMDGLNEAATVFIIGATNRPDLIDPALLRPGRFDKLLYVGPAEDHESKVGVLKALTRKFNLSEDVDLQDVVKFCPNNISGADFYGICSNAWMSAVRKLITRIEAGEIKSDELSEKDVIVCCCDFKEAILGVKPSISSEELRYFERLKVELS